MLALPVVPSSGLLLPKLQEKWVDVLFYGTLNDRRRAVLDSLRARGLAVEVATGAYGRELGLVVQRARVVLHVHQGVGRTFPIGRVLQAVVQGVAVVCEECDFAPQSDWSGSGIVFAPYDELARACAELARSPGEQERRAAESRAFAARIDFVHAFDTVATTMLERAHGAARVPAAQLDGDASRLLSNAEIEAILAEEAVQPPEAGAPLPKLEVAERARGKNKVEKAIGWFLIAFFLMGVIQYVRQLN